MLMPLAVLVAADPTLSTAGAPYAPMDVSKKMQDPLVPLTNVERNELMSEFKGMVHMGLRKVAMDQWEGKDMADCDRGGKSEKWSYRCEIITGEGNGFYYFYPTESRQANTLQEVDIRVHAADENLLDDFRRPVQSLLGRATFVNKTTVTSKPTGPIRRWDTGSDVAELFIDHSIRPEGSVRFVWMRAPLVSGDHASLPKPYADPE